MDEEKVPPPRYHLVMTRARESLHLVTSLKAWGIKRAAAHLADVPQDHFGFLPYTSKVDSDLGTIADFND